MSVAIKQPDSEACWNQNAQEWMRLYDSGQNLYREVLTTPQFLEFLPKQVGNNGLDVGCGHGANTRALRDRCIKVNPQLKLTGVDICEAFVKRASADEEADPKGIHYQKEDATQLTLKDDEYDFATAFMSLIDIENYDKAFMEVYRVLKPGGFFQFSYIHPAYMTGNFNVAGLDWVRDDKGNKIGKICTEYSQGNKAHLIEWELDGVKQKQPFQSYFYERSDDDWLNTMSDAGFVFQRSTSFLLTKEQVQEHPELQGGEVVPLFKAMRVIKPAI